ncbi:MAG: dihydrofolate reductase family protein [Candidatus Paceibacterota bacterium]
MTKEKIHVFGIAAISSDGFIAQNKKQVSTDWTSKEDKDWFWQRTAQAGAVVMGSTTFFATRKPGWPLPDRMNYVLTGDSTSVWDRYPTDEERDIVGQKANLVYLTASPQELIERAVADQFVELAVCGGTSVYTDFLPFMQTFYLTREPVELDKGLPLIKNTNLETLEELLNKEFELIEEIKLNDQGTFRQTWQRKTQS